MANNLYPYAYIRKKVCKMDDAVIPINSKVVQYGLGFFTGIRGYWNPQSKNLYLFRFEDHFIRMKEAAKILGMRFTWTYPKFKKLVIDLLKKNKVKEDCYIRPMVYAASTKLTPRFDNPDDDLTVYMMSLKNYFGKAEGLDVCISSWRRFDDDAISVKAKVSGSYAASALAKTEAVMNGFDEAIFLNRDGKVSEASSANIFGVKDGIVFTPPLAANNLNGITRRTIIELLRNQMKIEVREEFFDRSTLYAFDELFFSGTAAKITPIRSVDKRTIGTGRLGKITKKLQQVFDHVTNCDIEKYAKWSLPVY